MRISEMIEQGLLNGFEFIPIFDPQESEASRRNKKISITLMKGNRGPRGFRGLSAYEVWLSTGNTGSQEDFINFITGTDGVNGTNGVDGKSAYQLWLDNGNTGTVDDFLQSLIGLSAYEIWLNLGNTGSSQDFINSLKGETGDSNYEIWQKNGNENGTVEEFLEFIKGKDNYQLWLDNGNTGTIEDYFASLKGRTGDTGPRGRTGDQGLRGLTGEAGSKWYIGDTSPSDTIGVVSDFFLNGITGDVYGPKTADGWGSVSGNIRGPRGTIWYTGNADPSDNLGTNNDYYLKKTNGDVYLKINNTWGNPVTNIRGLPGSVWFYGEGSPSNALGNNDDYYLDTDSQDIYFKKDDAWTRILQPSSFIKKATTTVEGIVKLSKIDDVKDNTEGNVVVSASLLNEFRKRYGPHVGDYKFSDRETPLSEWEGWVVADGRQFSAVEYPEGASYFGVNNNNRFTIPNRAGRVPVGRGSILEIIQDDLMTTRFNTGETGGESISVLTRANLIRHSHHVVAEDIGDNQDLSSGNQLRRAANVGGGGLPGNNANFEYVLRGTSELATVGRSSEVGDSRPFSNMPPYWVGTWFIFIGFRNPQLLNVSADRTSDSQTLSTENDNASFSSIFILTIGRDTAPRYVTVNEINNSTDFTVVTENIDNQPTKVRITISSSEMQGVDSDKIGDFLVIVSDSSNPVRTGEIRLQVRHRAVYVEPFDTIVTPTSDTQTVDSTSDSKQAVSVFEVNTSGGTPSFTFGGQTVSRTGPGTTSVVIDQQSNSLALYTFTTTINSAVQEVVDLSYDIITQDSSNPTKTNTNRITLQHNFNPTTPPPASGGGGSGGGGGNDTNQPTQIN